MSSSDAVIGTDTGGESPTESGGFVGNGFGPTRAAADLDPPAPQAKRARNALHRGGAHPRADENDVAGMRLSRIGLDPP